MNSDSLADLHVLVTRPAEQQRILKQAIEARAGKVLCLPLIKISALDQSQAVQRITSKVQNLDNYQILIFVSTNAVKYGAEIINNFWPQFPAGLTVLAMGPSTAKCAADLLQLEVLQPITGMTSEDLLKLPLLNNVSGKKIGIIRGQGGRELLAETLRSRGAQVDYLEAYARERVDYATMSFCNQLHSAEVNVLSVTSSESLNRLDSLLADNKEEMSLLPLLVPSQRVAEQGLKLGFTKPVNMDGADVTSFLAALEALAKQ